MTKLQTEGSTSNTLDEGHKQIADENTLRKDLKLSEIISERRSKIRNIISRASAMSLNDQMKQSTKLLSKAARRRKRAARKANESARNCCLSCLLWGYPPQCSCKGC